jgi:hypothetical protein
MGPIANGSTEHAAIITRVWGDGDTVDGPVTVNAVMFPDGGGDTQFQNQILLYDSREAAVASGVNRRCAYWAANS